MSLVVWVNHALAARLGNSNARFLWALHDELQSRNIEIACPQRDMWIRSALPSAVLPAGNDLSEAVETDDAIAGPRAARLQPVTTGMQPGRRPD